MQTAVQLITHYGYAGIFTLLALGIVGLPIPDETLLMFVGYLAFEHRLQPVWAFSSAFLGSVSGITISYSLGRAFGLYLPQRWRTTLRLTPERIQRAENWFRSGGEWILVVGYFVPGVRHLTAYAAGASSLGYRPFSIFAYVGAFIWSSTFLAFGYFLGEGWNQGAPRFQRNLAILMAVAVVAILIYLHWRRNNRPDSN